MQCISEFHFREASCIDVALGFAVRLVAAGIGSVTRFSSHSWRLSLEVRIAAFAFAMGWVAAFAFAMGWVCLPV